MGDALDQLADRALRAGVVIHALDINGLSVDDTLGIERGPSDSLDAVVTAESDLSQGPNIAASRAIYTTSLHNPFPKKPEGSLSQAATGFFMELVR